MNKNNAKSEERKLQLQKDELLANQLEAYISACVGDNEYLSLKCRIKNGRVSEMPFLGDIKEDIHKYTGQTVEELLQSEGFKKDLSTIRDGKNQIKHVFIRKMRARVEDLDYPGLPVFFLEMNGIHTVRELVCKTEADLRKIHKGGNAEFIENLKEALYLIGLKLGMKV